MQHSRTDRNPLFTGALLASVALIASATISTSCSPAAGGSVNNNAVGTSGTGSVTGGGAAPTGVVAGGGAAPTGVVGASGAAPTGVVAGGGAAPTGVVAGGGAAPTGVVAGGGAAPTGAAGGTATGTGMVTCTNTDLATLPIDETGWVDRTCNNAGIQGAFYCYDDGVNPSGCTADVPPWVPAESGMCLTGNTTVDDTYAAWGAGIGLSLNDTGMTETMASVKSAYSAASNGVLGFSITITGDTGGLPIRIQMPKVADPELSPFVEVPGAGSYDIVIADALIPEAWEQCTGADCLADANSIFDLQIQVVGGNTAASYSFCVTNITPITDGTNNMQVGNLADYGSPVCEQYAKINVPNYAVQNNLYNTGYHCIQAKTDNGSLAGFNLTQVSSNVMVGGAPGSYPSIVLGWHLDGTFNGAYQAARQVSGITSIPTSISATVPGAGRYNLSYDNWLGPNANPGASTANTLEHMIWLNERETTPIGSQDGSIDLAGTTWEVWHGQNGGGWYTVSYVRVTNTTQAEFDVMEFINHSVQQGYGGVSASSYLLSIQAGFEIWEASQNFSVDSFSATIN